MEVMAVLTWWMKANCSKQLVLSAQGMATGFVRVSHGLCLGINRQINKSGLFFSQGAGTAIGELPPYFMARAARLSGAEPDDEEYQEFEEMLEHAETAQVRTACKTTELIKHRATQRE